MEFANLDYAVADRVAEITMRRAPVNAINHELIEDINNAYRKAKADPEVRAIILTSAFERSFSGRNGPCDDPQRPWPRFAPLPREALLRDARPAIPHGQANHRRPHRACACCGRDARGFVRRLDRGRHREPRVSRDPGRRDSGYALRAPAAADRPPQGLRAAVQRPAGLGGEKPAPWAWSTGWCRPTR